ncbi:MAG: tRNA (adenosine(37)-N6)-threonylcarbamoyltransferase complex transferase subunit TsaD [Actinobacteria bacterium]|nr:tRNA (adenosine(37)-N6)-threonylcarbamoyltransferase complex transferase subunit TsaD [Actinomycetota bacterium]
MIILGIETSCDETAAAVVETHSNASLRVLSNVVSSQIEIHKKYGGVVPEVAAREHVLNILPVVNEALIKAGINPATPLSKWGVKSPQPPFNKVGKFIDAIAVTIGPGLITSLIVGIETAKVLSYAWNIPVVAVNHIEGHIYANFIGKLKTQNSKLKTNISFPALILTVSGGHTMLVLMKGHGKYKIIGETRDDAAGEAFDKAAAMLGIGYPGGPVISAKAEQLTMNNEQLTIKLPRPMINSKDYDFSFSGLKTALLYELKKNPNYKLQITNYCYEFQQAVIDVLISKTIKAAEEYKIKTIMLSGGVSANIELRKQMTEAIKSQVPNSQFLIPDLKYTTDNAAMIAAAGYYKARDKKFTPWRKLKVDCNAEL